MKPAPPPPFSPRPRDGVWPPPGSAALLAARPAGPAAGVPGREPPTPPGSAGRGRSGLRRRRTKSRGRARSRVPRGARGGGGVCVVLGRGGILPRAAGGGAAGAAGWGGLPAAERRRPRGSPSPGALPAPAAGAGARQRHAGHPGCSGAPAAGLAAATCVWVVPGSVTSVSWGASLRPRPSSQGGARRCAKTRVEILAEREDALSQISV